MKPAAFDYYDPSTVEEAVQLLNEYGSDAKVLAGGQSLVPLLNMRLARPAVIVDINRIAALDYLKVEGDVLRVGAITRQRAVERSPHAEAWPLLRQALRHVGHVQIRNRGTVVGSLVHADPSAELPATAAALEAEFVIRGPGGERVVGWDDFFVTYLTTAVEPNELVVEVRFPRPPEGSRSAFLEVARRHGDFALAGVAALVSMNDDGTLKEVRLACCGVDDRPVRAREVEEMLRGERPTDAVLTEAGRKVAASVSPGSDLHASADYRRHLVSVLVKRAIREAVGQVAVQAV